MYTMCASSTHHLSTHTHTGETTAIGCLPQPSQLGPDVHPGGSWGAMQNELVSQIFTGPPQMVLVSTAGVLELERRRPVDVLQELLQVQYGRDVCLRACRGQAVAYVR